MVNTKNISESDIEGFDAVFRGKLVRPGDDTYDTVRQVHNGMIDKRPALIACCTGVSDVVDAVKIGVDFGLEISVRGGGHNVAGRAVCDDGLMIDLSNMKGIYVDVQAHTVRAQAGVTWNELNRETQLHGLATTGGMVSSTGVAGLTLGGGLGWLMGKYGLAIDNLISVELVTAAGEVLQVSEKKIMMCSGDYTVAEVISGSQPLLNLISMMWGRRLLADWWHIPLSKRARF